MDPAQTAPRGSTLFAKMTFKNHKQMAIVVISGLRIKEEFKQVMCVNI